MSFAGTSVLLPMSLENNYTAEILVCGGTKFNPNPGRDLPADDSCGRIRPLDPNPEWVMETMPDARIVPDAIITANGQVVTCAHELRPGETCRN